MEEKTFDESNIRGRILWLVYYCIENEIDDISAKSHFIQRCNLGNSFISDLEKNEGQTPKNKNLRKIVNGIGVNREWLYHGTGEPFRTEAQESPTPYRHHKPKGKESDIMIPFYKKVKPAAGGGRIIARDDEADMVYVTLPRSYIVDNLHANPSEIIILEIWNDSMEPEIKSGDVVFITRKVPPPYEGNVYIIRMGESLLCKYIQELPGNKLRVFSENKRYKEFEIQLGEESQESFEIYGRIVGHLHSRF